MGDGVKRSGGPGSSDDVASRPDVGFHDDHVGGYLKADEAAKQRAAQGVMQRRPKRIEQEPEQVGEVAHAHRNHEETDLAREARRQQRGLVRGQGPTRAKARPGAQAPATAAVDEDVRRLESRIDLLMATLAQLEGDGEGGDGEGQPHPRPASEAAMPALQQQVRAALQERGGLGADSDAGDAAALDEGAAELAEAKAAHGRIQRRRGRRERDGGGAFGDGDGDGDDAGADGPPSVSARQQRVARDLRFLLQHLIAGGVGLTMAADPAVTFKRIFAGLLHWPQNVPPGFQPVTEADFDQFLAWIFRPDGAHPALAAADDVPVP